MTLSISSSAKATPIGFRSDIQGLRAVAVGLVVIFHIFPNLVSGGYVGVDVFFVISGYLISSLLIRRVERDGRVNFKQFYISRARRLLPAACLTLIVTGLACLFILPKSQLSGVGREILASAFYLENFFLYFQGRDYLASETAPSPMQHFWSLSIEEQFYIFWPFVIAIGVILAKRIKMSARALILIFLTLITLVSFFLSATISEKNPGAYFLTSTRVWELALGALLAFGQPFLRLRTHLTRVLRWLGLFAILFAGMTFTKATVFPGTAALIPTLGALALLLPRTSGFLDPATILSFRPMVYIGDISYSLYLWHWPIIVLGGYLIVGSMTPWHNVLLFALMMGLSHVSKYYVEDRFRHFKEIKNPGRRTIGLSTTFLVGSSIVAVALIAPNLKPMKNLQLEELADYPGAYALQSSAVLPIRDFIPSASTAISDNPDVYRDGCHVSSEGQIPIPCIYGNPKSAVTVALVGDSHAAQYLPALRKFAKSRDFRIVSHTKSSCPFLDAVTINAGRDYSTCRDWNQSVMSELLELKPDVVVTAKFSSTILSNREPGLSNDEAVSEALVRSWKVLKESGIPVVAIAYTPRFPNKVPDCISLPKNKPSDCDLDRATALSRFDHIRAAGVKFPSAIIADLNDSICSAETCATIVGNVLVYRDAHHLTATYSRTLDRALGEFILQAVDIEVVENDGVSEYQNFPIKPSDDLLDLIPNRQEYPGATSLVAGEEKDMQNTFLRPSLSLLRRDFHDSFANGCYSSAGGFEVKPCEVGPIESSKHIVVVGDNSAAMWMSAIEPYAKYRGVRVTTFLKSGCPLTSVAPEYRGLPNQDCVKWGEAVVEEINNLNPDIVLTTTYATLTAAQVKEGETGKTALGRGIVNRLKQIDQKDTHFIALAQLPTQDQTLDKCLESRGMKNLGEEITLQQVEVCGTPRVNAKRRQDPLKLAAKHSNFVEYLDMTDYFCRETFCPAALGGLITYKDSGHVTDSYMQTVIPFLGVELDERLGIEKP